MNGRDIVSIKVNPHVFQWERNCVQINQSNFKKNLVVGPSRNISDDGSEKKETLNIIPS